MCRRLQAVGGWGEAWGWGENMDRNHSRSADGVAREG